MHLPKQCIEEFRQLWKECFDADLSEDDAKRQSEAVLVIASVAIQSASRDPPLT